MRIWFMILLFIAAGAVNGCRRTEPEQTDGPTLPIGANLGEVYPSYVFPSLDGGRPTALSEFRGKKVILHHFASW